MSSEARCRWSAHARKFRMSRKLTAVARLEIILKTIPALFIRERLMAFAFLARDNYDLPRQLQNTRVTNKFIDEERGSESFDTNPSSLALLLTVVPLACARGRFRNESLPYNSPYTPPIGPSRLLPKRIHNFSA